MSSTFNDDDDLFGNDNDLFGDDDDLFSDSTESQNTDEILGDIFNESTDSNQDVHGTDDSILSSSVEDTGENDNGSSDIKKTALIAIAVGAVVITGVFFGMRILKNGNKGSTQSSSQQPVQQEYQQSIQKNSDSTQVSQGQENVQEAQNNNQQSVQQSIQNEQVQGIPEQNNQQNVKEEQVQSDSNKVTSQTVESPTSNMENNSNNNELTITGSKKDKNWKSFESSKDIEFNKEYVSSIFTVISTSNYVKLANDEREIMVKTVVTGSLSGFTGTYEIEVPYSKGSQLLAGNTFDVEVQIGKYGEKIVVGEIVY